MAADPRFFFFTAQAKPLGLLPRILAVFLTGALLVAAVLFSLAVFTALALAGLALWAWLKWKMYRLRKTVAQAAAGDASAAGRQNAGAFREQRSTVVIEGEWVREAAPETGEKPAENRY